MLQKGRWPEGPEGLWFKQKAEGLQLKKEFLEITPLAASWLTWKATPLSAS